MARGTRPVPTPKQERAITLIKERALKGRQKHNDPSSIKKCLLEAGYSPESVKQYSNIVRGIRPHLQDTIEWMKEHRLRVAAHMEKQIKYADYADLTRAFAGLTENIQLLEGKPTQNIAVIAETRRRELDALIEDYD